MGTGIEMNVIERIRSVRSRVGSIFRRSEQPQVGIVPKSYIATYLPCNPTIVEAGAHTGQDTVELATMFPEGRVFAFEPVPDLFKKLVRTTRRLRNVTPCLMALAHSDGILKLNVSEGGSNASSSILKPKRHLEIHPEVEFKNSIEVKGITLDRWATENEIERVDFLWLDLQGAELAVLKAAPRILQNTSAIYMEVSLIETYEGCPLYAEVRGWLEARGFVVDREELPWVDGGNVLFVRQKGIIAP
jgi:2-O-methyltransferase